MKTLTIRGLPDEVHEGLKKRAKKNRRSLNQEVIAGLVQFAGRVNRDRNNWVAEILAASDRVYENIETPLTASEIREAIEEGRS